MKLYATLETSRGKTVSVSDNEQITATVYDGNLKAYSVIIEWCDIGDIIDNDGNDLPESKKTKGAIVTTREWRNQPDDRRKGKVNQHQHIWQHDYLSDEENSHKCTTCDATMDSDGGIIE